jgi:hypothetical protein
MAICRIGIPIKKEDGVAHTHFCNGWTNRMKAERGDIIYLYL